MDTCATCRFFKPRAGSNAGECGFRLPPPARPEAPPVVTQDDSCDLHESE